MNAEALMKQLGIDKEHKGKIEEVTRYLEENRIQELFNVSVATDIWSQKIFLIQVCLVSKSIM